MEVLVAHVFVDNHPVNRAAVCGQGDSARQRFAVTPAPGFPAGRAGLRSEARGAQCPSAVSLTFTRYLTLRFGRMRTLPGGRSALSRDSALNGRGAPGPRGGVPRQLRQAVKPTRKLTVG